MLQLILNRVEKNTVAIPFNKHGNLLERCLRLYKLYPTKEKRKLRTNGKKNSKVVHSLMSTDLCYSIEKGYFQLAVISTIVFSLVK